VKRSKRIDKVTAFVTRGSGAAAELLLLRHPVAGVQLPAGTVDLGENPEAAVLRELREEAGLSAVIADYLGKVEGETPPGQGVILRPTKIFDEPSFDASSGGYALRRGSPVEVVGLAGDFAEVIAEPIDFRFDPPSRVAGVRGFVRRSLLANGYVRHFYHLAPIEPAPEEWDVFSDAHSFHLFWSPLRPKPALHPLQEPWLDPVYGRLLELTAASSQMA
jgi:8-oxo-dGTP pyrophosphatase MutT (NUDIX family)